MEDNMVKPLPFLDMASDRDTLDSRHLVPEAIKYTPGEENPSKMLKRLGFLRANEGRPLEERILILMEIYGLDKQTIMLHASHHETFDKFWVAVEWSEQRDVKHWYRYPDERPTIG